MQTASRLVPFTVAGVICFLTAFLLGAGFWFFFGTHSNLRGSTTNTIVQTSNQNTSVANSNIAASNSNANVLPATTSEIKKAPAGEVKITGGEVSLGGGETKLPVRRVNVSDFFIGETEVTNSQYEEFIVATEHKAPAGWKDGKHLPGTADEPVIGVSWTDANDYCEWLSKQLNATVRLPNEAEWERAARGDTDNKYPWGNEWNDEAAQSAETKGKIRPVKSLTAGRSPFGVFEMVGNVWEWTSDLAVDEFDQPILYGKSKQRIIKGGSAREEKKYLLIDSRAARPEDKPSDVLGFRYVVIRK